MHISSLLRMDWFVRTYLTEKLGPLNIIDIGSYDVNGSYKQFFNKDQFSYTGFDMAPGPNVDIVPKFPYAWTEIENDTFDVVISGQALEHIEFFWVTVQEMVRILKPNGLMCIIAPRGFVRHRYPVDCYRFDTDGLVALARYCNLTILHASTNLAPVGAPPAWYSSHEADSMLIARKPSNWKSRINLSTYTCTPANITELATGFIELKEQNYNIVAEAK